MTDRPAVPPFHPSRLVLILTRHPDRGTLLTCPHLPAWAVVARGPHQLARAVDEAWRELATRAYAERRQQEYDLAPLADQVVRPAPSAWDPWEWRELDDGRWLSPGGRKYRADAAVVGKVRAARDRQPQAG